MCNRNLGRRRIVRRRKTSLTSLSNESTFGYLYPLSASLMFFVSLVKDRNRRYLE